MASTENGGIVEFYRDAVQNNFKSAQAGRPIYEEKDFVRITTPGDTKTVVVELVNDRHKNQYPRAWEAYEKGMEEVTEGTPISQWNQASISQARELAHFNVRTVEQLAMVSDGNVQTMGPGYRQLRERAKQYLAATQDDASNTEAAREAEQLRERVELLEEQNAALKQQIATLKASGDGGAQKRGPGRPPKQEQQE